MPTLLLAEHHIEPYWVSVLGVNTSRLLWAESTSRLMALLLPLQLKYQQLTS